MNISNTISVHSTEFASKLLPELLLPVLPDLQQIPLDEPPAPHETLLVMPATEHAPLDLHIENCHRRCVTLYDTQQVAQFGG